MNFLKHQFPEDEDILSSPEKSEEKSSLLKRIFRNEDGQFYSEIITKGFIWVVMFIVSLVALILVFKDDYTNKEVVVVNDKSASNYMTTENPNENNANTDFTFQNKITNNGEDNQNNKDLPNGIKSVTSDNDSTGNKNEDSQIGDSNNIKKDNIITKNSDSNIKNLILKTSDKSIVKRLPKEAFKSSDSIKNIWLVTIFSDKNLNAAKQKWDHIKKIYPSLFLNKKPYFIKTEIPSKGIYYRVSLGDESLDKQNPIFNDAQSATKYCKFLKSQKIDCFIFKTNTKKL